MIIKCALKLVLLVVIFTTTSAHAGQQNILILGDSISAAYGMSVAQGWVALLERRLADSHPDVTIINASISGETTGGGLRRLPELLASHKPTIVLVELGANDGLRGYPIKNFRHNLNEIVTLSQQIEAKVILLQMEVPPNYGTRYTSAFHDSYTLVAESTGSILAPFIMEGVAGNSALIQGDGLHPTVAAQPHLLDNVLPTLLRELD